MGNSGSFYYCCPSVLSGVGDCWLHIVIRHCSSGVWYALSSSFVEFMVHLKFWPENVYFGYKHYVDLIAGYVVE